MDKRIELKKLKTDFEGNIFTDISTRTIYSTDASAYKEMPVAVAWPKSKEDIKKLIYFARENNTSLIPQIGRAHV